MTLATSWTNRREKSSRNFDLGAILGWIAGLGLDGRRRDER
jgi:hypothetical protein